MSAKSARTQLDNRCKDRLRKDGLPTMANQTEQYWAPAQMPPSPLAGA